MSPIPQNWPRLLRSTPLRLAFLLILLFTIINLLMVSGAYLTLKTRTEQNISENIASELSGFDVSATAGALRTLVRAKARVFDPADRVYLFVGDDGRTAGNARAVISNGQVILREQSADHPLSEAGYLQETRRLSSGVLVVAESLEPVIALRRTFTTVLALTFLPSALASILLGLWIARRSARRVARIEATLDQIASGDLGARYREQTDRRDDLTLIGEGVNHMAEKQEAAVVALRQVSADIAHDLRTPLQRIAVLLADLGDQLEDGTEPARIADRAADEANRAVSVFQSLLQIAQIEGGAPTAEFDKIDLVAIAREMVDLYEPAADEAAMTLNHTLPDGPVWVMGDRTMISQAIANIMENALRHAKSGKSIKVSVKATDTGGCLTVADSGPGIPESEKDKVLQRLYRLEASRTTPGNGLGLSLVSAIAQLHQAELTLSDNCPGLRVSLQFPAVTD